MKTLFFTTFFFLSLFLFANEAVITLEEDPKLSIIKNESYKSFALDFLSLSTPPTGIIKTKSLSLTQETFKTVPHILTRFTELEGLSYFSISKNKERILFNSIYPISKLPSNERQPYKNIESLKKDDPIINLEGATFPLKFIFYQDDTSFGDSFWECQLQPLENGWALSYENLTPIKLGLIKLVEAKQMKMLFFINPTDFTAIINANMPSVNIFKNRIKGSLDNRITAIANHFLAKLQN